MTGPKKRAFKNGLILFAWYQATQANKVAGVSESGSLTITGKDPASADVQNVYLKITIDLADDPVDLTTLDMMTTGITSEGRENWTKSTDPYGHVSLTAASTRGGAATQGSKYGWQWYTDSSCTPGNELSDAAVTNIKKAELSVIAAAGARLRITVTDPATAEASTAANLNNDADCKKFYTAFNGTLADDDLQVGTLAVANEGSVSGTIEFWYSIAGETPDIIKHDYVDKDFEGAISETNLTVSFTLAVTRYSTDGVNWAS